ncbi:MAG TPA: MBL fold metallo-hydrolase [Gemmatimonadaceae bacterium]|nr:MBL fold metallo-hydrolase [Gemmatimonadaceae bacterium]
MKLRFLGTGTSFGVPQIACECAVCRSDDPRDRRLRSAVLIDTDGGTRILIDTPPELRLQLLAAGVDALDVVLFTHDHADHTHGIDDIRAITMRRTAALPMIGPAETIASLAQRFPYVFDPAIPPPPGSSKPEGQGRSIEPGQRITIGDATIEAIEVPHGPKRVFGYRIGPVAYVTDAKSVPPQALTQLRGVELLVINALLRRQHPLHLSIDEAIQVAREVGARRTFFTHLTHHESHAALAAELPAGIAPAHDGLVVEV